MKDTDTAIILGCLLVIVAVVFSVTVVPFLGMLYWNYVIVGTYAFASNASFTQSFWVFFTGYILSFGFRTQLTFGKSDSK